MYRDSHFLMFLALAPSAEYIHLTKYMYVLLYIIYNVVENQDYVRAVYANTIQSMSLILHAVERMGISKYSREIDGQTDRQTDRDK